LIDRMALRMTLPAIPKTTSSNVITDTSVITVVTSTTSTTATTTNPSSLSSITNTTTNSDVQTVTNTTEFGQSRDNNATQIAWIRQIGYAMLKYVEIEIGGEVIDRHYGEWLYIWSILTTKNIDDGGLRKLIGDVPELTEFTDSKDEYT